MPPNIKFYYSPGARSLCPHILLHEIGIDFEGIPLRGSERRNSVFSDLSRVNPKMKVPTISINDELITEVPAVATVISYLAPDRHLMGKKPMDVCRVDEWMNWLSGTLHSSGFGIWFRPGRCSDDPDAYKGIRLKSLQVIQDCFFSIEQNLNGFYAVGSSFTAVDAYLLVFYRWGKEIGLEMGGLPKFTAFVDVLSKRESVKAALKAEGIEFTL